MCIVSSTTETYFDHPCHCDGHKQIKLIVVSTVLGICLLLACSVYGYTTGTIQTHNSRKKIRELIWLRHKLSYVCCIDHCGCFLTRYSMAYTITSRIHKILSKPILPCEERKLTQLAFGVPGVYRRDQNMAKAVGTKAKSISKHKSSFTYT